MKEFEFYHGAILAKLIHHSDRALTLSLFSTGSNATYVLNGTIGLYFKYSTKRMKPWIFTMQKVHLKEIIAMGSKLEKVYVILICGDDGAATLTMDETFQIVSSNQGDSAWISVSRTPRSEYSVKGSMGALSYRIAKNDLVRKLLGKQA